jgi:hypothetical protein
MVALVVLSSDDDILHHVWSSTEKDSEPMSNRVKQGAQSTMMMV